MRGSLLDLRQSLRGFAREPGFTAIAVLALAIGVGSSTAMFSVLDAALLRPLPYTAPERLVQLLAVDGAGQRAPMSAVEFFQLEKHAKTVEAIGVLHPDSDTVASASGVRTVRTAELSASLFRTLGIAPVIGRAFDLAADLAGPQTVVIVSDAFWGRELGKDPAVLGRVLQVDHRPVAIVGVLPPGAVFPRAESAELFFPLGITPQMVGLPAGRNGLYGFARLAPRVSAGAARAEIDSIMRATSGQFERNEQARGLGGLPASPARSLCRDSSPRCSTEWARATPSPSPSSR